MGKVAILGIFVADATFRADRMPKIGETLLGRSFSLGPGGKGSNQAVAAARAGGDVQFVSKLGPDTFGEMGVKLWNDAGVRPEIIWDQDGFTGAASIFVDDQSGNNAIIVCPGASGTITTQEIRSKSEVISQAQVFLTQLETPIDATLTALQIARDAGVCTILNPAPAVEIADSMIGLCDIVTPNESEAEGLTGIAVQTIDDARRASEASLELGAGAAIITLGENGSFYKDRVLDFHVPAMNAGEVAETTGAGDAFNGALATAISNGNDIRSSLKFATATSAISVTRPGAAASMPELDDVRALLAVQ